MRMDPIQLKKQDRLIDDYRNNKEKIFQYFDYSPFHDYEQRVRDLNHREFNRERLAEVLHIVNEQWSAPQSTHENIDQLKKENSVVVIGGQQAGLMTGPLYTINKIISIIQFAKQQEEVLQIPVIPVFWIAGEDHDYDEINHVFLLEESEMKKHRIMQQVTEKHPISNLIMDKAQAEEWLERLFKQLNETEYTKGLYATVKKCLDQSKTFVDFFARLIFQLFTEEGIVLVDSAQPEIRQLENEYFVQLIEKQPEISKSVYFTLQELKQAGYSISLDVEKSDAHLFFHKDNERILLQRNEAGEWVGKQNEVKLSTKEMISIARETPELLSNNVVSRPFMQELLFPSLAFVAGNGEIGYWAVLKSAFNKLNMKMPPVLPRLSFTYINHNIEKTLNEFVIHSEHVLNYGVAENKIKWLASQSDPPIFHLIQQFKETMDNAHRPLRNVAKGIREDLGELSQKNIEHLYREVDYLGDRMMKAVEKNYKKELADFDLINNYLYPFGGLQERVWNPLPIINEQGPEPFRKLAGKSCSFEQEHYIVYY